MRELLYHDFSAGKAAAKVCRIKRTSMNNTKHSWPTISETSGTSEILGASRTRCSAYTGVNQAMNENHNPKTDQMCNSSFVPSRSSLSETMSMTVNHDLESVLKENAFDHLISVELVHKILCEE